VKTQRYNDPNPNEVFTRGKRRITRGVEGDQLKNKEWERLAVGKQFSDLGGRGTLHSDLQGKKKKEGENVEM